MPRNFPQGFPDGSQGSPGRRAAAVTGPRDRDQHYARGVVLVLLGGLALSPGGLLIRFIEEATDWQLLLYRSGILGLSILVLIAVRYRGDVVGAFRGAGWTGLAGGIVLGAGFTTYVLALRHTTIANGLFVISSAPLLPSSPPRSAG